MSWKTLLHDQYQGVLLAGPRENDPFAHVKTRFTIPTPLPTKKAGDRLRALLSNVLA